MTRRRRSTLELEQLNLFASRQARDRGMQRAADTAGAVWAEEAREAALEVADELETFTADDVWPRGLRNPPKGNKRAIGPVLNKLRRDGLLVKVGLRSTSRVTAHCAPHGIWRKA